MGKEAADLPSPSGHPAPGGAGSLAGLLLTATARLQRALGLERPEARLEARILAARALDVDRAWLIAHDRDVPNPTQVLALESLIARRERGEPVAYILGEREFHSRVFRVTPDVLIPRPETELLVEAALARLPKDRPARVLDLGTGSGCIAITLALGRPDLEVVGIDASRAALAVASENAFRLEADTVRLQYGNWYAGLGEQRFDMIVSNPPYIPRNDPHLGLGDLIHEPQEALVSGPDGLDAIRSIVAGAADHLESGGLLMFEHGYDQQASSRILLTQAGLECVFTLFDMAGQARVSGGQWQGPR